MGIAGQRDRVDGMGNEHGKQPLPGGGVAVPGVEIGGQTVRRQLLRLGHTRFRVLRELNFGEFLRWNDRDVELAHQHLLAQYLPGSATGFAALQRILQPRFLIFTQHLPLGVVKVILKKRLYATGPLNAFAIVELLVAAD